MLQTNVPISYNLKYQILVNSAGEGTTNNDNKSTALTVNTVDTIDSYQNIWLPEEDTMVIVHLGAGPRSSNPNGESYVL